MLIPVLQLVSFNTVMFYVGYLYFTDSFLFHCFSSLYIILIDVLIYSAAQLQECLINLFIYLLTSLHRTDKADTV